MKRRIDLQEGKIQFGNYCPLDAIGPTVEGPKQEAVQMSKASTPLVVRVTSYEVKYALARDTRELAFF